jgi:hypothetical protein
MSFFEKDSAFQRRAEAMRLDPYAPPKARSVPEPHDFDPLGPLPLPPGKVAVDRELLERTFATLDQLTTNHDPGRGPRTAASGVLDDAVTVRDEISDLLR